MPLIIGTGGPLLRLLRSLTITVSVAAKPA
jgi:hypothetical protein